jgi:DNA-directed RNA polymerase subunit RPC12/RpoP
MMNHCTTTKFPIAYPEPTWYRGVKCPYCLSRIYPKGHYTQTCIICGNPYQPVGWAEVSR